MKKSLLILGFILCRGFFLFALDQSDKIAKMESYLTTLERLGRFSGNVIVAQSGNPVYTKSIGYANREWKVPNAADTRFRLASVSKQFTAMLILQLVQETKIKLGGKIVDYIPYYRKDVGEKVTIRQLLNHTSGIPSFTSRDSFLLKESKLRFAQEDFVKRYCSGDLEFEPGSKFSYNNTGYYLLGVIIEKVTGMSYDQALRERIFSKLGMNDSGVDHHESIIEKRATGYTRDLEGKEFNSMYCDMDVAFSAGAIYSTIHDMVKWDRALSSDLLLVKAFRDSMFRPGLSNYGYGIGINTMFGRTIHGHSGGVSGFSTNILRFPGENLCFIVLMNIDYGNASLVCKDLAAIYFGEKFTMHKEHKAIVLEEQKMLPYAGVYQLMPEFTISIFVEEGHFFLQGTGQPRIELLPESETEFFYPHDEISVSFEKDKKGKVKGLTLYQNGEYKAPKIK